MPILYGIFFFSGRKTELKEQWAYILLLFSVILGPLPHFHSSPGVGVFWVVTINTELTLYITEVNEKFTQLQG